MNPVIVFSHPNSLESRALTAWLWEWNLPWIEGACSEAESVKTPKLRTVINGKPFSGTLAQQREHLSKFFGLKKPTLHD